MVSKPIKVLVADDDKDDADLVKEALESLLITPQVDRVPDGIACLRYIKTLSQPNIVFLDLNMPLKNGLHCLKDIHNLELLPGIPIIIYSTSNNIRDIDEAYNYGAAFYIVKPGSFKSLCQIIKHAFFLLDKPRVKRVDKANFVLSETTINLTDSTLIS